MTTQTAVHTASHATLQAQATAVPAANVRSHATAVIISTTTHAKPIARQTAVRTAMHVQPSPMARRHVPAANADLHAIAALRVTERSALQLHPIARQTTKKNV